MIAPGCLPNLIIIGAHKAGTSSLHYYLGLHPDIFMSRFKELNFFVAEHNWTRGPGWYRSQFPAQAVILGESSPLYADYPASGGVPARMHSVIPDARLIYLVRDPVERILSHYTHWFAVRQENDALSDVLARPPALSSYINRSLYHAQLQQYLPYYDLKDILVVASEDLRDRRRQTMSGIFRFLGVDVTFDSPRFHRLKHQGSEKRRLSPLGRAVHDASYRHMNPLSPAVQRLLTRWLEIPLSRPFARPELTDGLRLRLQDALYPDAERLRALTGLTLSDWSF